MTEEVDRTQTLLRRWHAGDGAALDELLAAHLSWIEARVRRRTGERLRAKEETQDLVQDVMVAVLRDAPRFTVADGRSFRALMAAIVENVIRDRHDWFSARRREMARERPLATDTVLALDPPAAAPAGPPTRAAEDELEARVRLALELLPPDDRRIVVRRAWDGAGFAEIGAELDLTPDAARMRFHRALLRLAERAEGLLAGLVDEDPSDG